MENQVPMHRFNEVIQERNELRSKMAEISSAEEEARAKSLEEQGKFETLLTEERQKGKVMAEKYTQLEDTFNSYVNGEKERLLADLPETKRERYQDVDLEIWLKILITKKLI
jgi:muconolactone delta-isomerase